MNPITRNLAIVIGINAYQPSKGISSLKTAVNDATKLASILENRYQYQVQLLTDTDATLGQLQQLLATLKQGAIALPNETIQIAESDRLLFYFAGHGTAADELDEHWAPKGYLVPQDATNDLSTFLPMSDLHDALVELPCRHLLIFLDCCFADSFRWAGGRRDILTPRQMYRERYDRFTNGIAQQVITSAAYDEKALDSIEPFGRRESLDARQQYSPFAQLLFQLLEAKPENNREKFIDAILEDGIITATEIYAYLQGTIAKVTTGQTPGFCQLKKHDKGEYIFPLPGFQPKELRTAEVLTKSLNPYRGLESYKREDSQLFFGRTKLRKKLANFVEKQQLTAVVGGSGSGKSSLVKAGLIPDLDRIEPKAWQILHPIRPGERPFTALNFYLKDGGLSAVTRGENGEDFNPEQLGEILLAWSRENPGLKLLIVIDQFEELITRCWSDRDREDFLQLLATTLQREELSNQFRLVVTLRSDFEPQFGDTALSSLWQQSKFKVTPMSREELREAIVEPAAARVMFFESSKLVDKLIDEVIDMPGALPLLSFTLSELYFKYLDGGRGDRTISEADYRELGGVMLSLTKRGDRVCQELKEKEVRESTIRNVMLRMVATRGGELARRRVTATELEYPEPENEDVGKIIKAFTDVRLLVGDSSESESYVEPAHDELIRGWPRIKRWLDERADAPVERRGGIKRLFDSLFLRLKRDSNRRSNIELERPLKVNLPLQRELTTAANNWVGKKEKEGEKKAVGFLWDRDPRLPQLEEVGESEESWFNKVEANFVRRSIDQKWKNFRFWVRLTTGVVLGLSTLTIAAVVGWRNAVIGQIGNSRQTSEAYLSSGQELEAVIEGLRAADTLSHPLLQLLPERQLGDRVRGTLQKVLYAVKERNRLECHEGPVNSVSFSSDGKRFATAGEDGNLCLWDLAGNLLKKFPTDQGSIAMVRFSPNDRHLITGNTTTGEEDGVLRLWDLKGDRLAEYQATFFFTTEDYRISFSKDGQQLAILNNDIAGVWDLQGNLLGKLEGHNGSVTSVTFSPDGSKIATAGVDGSVRLWDSNRKLLTEFTADENGVKDLAFSPNSQKLATAGGWFTTRLWDLQGNKLAEFEGPPQPKPIAEGAWIERVMFSPNGQQLATVEVRGRAFLVVRLWDVGNPRNWMFELPNDRVRFSHDSDLLIAIPATFGSLSILKNDWRGDRLAEIGDSGVFYDAVFSPTGKHLVTGGFGTVGIWDLSTKEAARLDRPNKDFRRTLPMQLYCRKNRQRVGISLSLSCQFYTVISPDNQIFVTSLLGPIQKLWNSSGEPIAELTGHTPQFSPDSQSIVTVNNNVVFLWNRQGKKLEEFYAENPIIKFSSNGQQVAIASDNGSIQLWNRQTNTTAKLPGIDWYDGYDIKELVFTPEGKLYGISHKYPGEPRLWNLSDGKMVAQLKGGNVILSSEGGLLATEEKRDREGKTIFYGGPEVKTMVYLWDLSGQIVASKEFDFAVAETMLFSPDQKSLAIEAAGKTYLWNYSKQQVKELTSSIMSLSPDGSLIITKSLDEIPRLWDWQGNMLTKLEGHTASVDDVMFSLDYDRLITTSQGDGSIRLWDLEGNQLAQFTFLPNNVASLLILNSERQILVTEDNKGIVKLWRIEELDELMQRGCNWMRDYYQTNPPNVAESDRNLCDDILNSP